MDYYTLFARLADRNYVMCYTPPGYETGISHIPYRNLQHGGGENESAGSRQGKIANMADDLLTQGRMDEMIIVMNTGYAFRGRWNQPWCIEFF